MTRLSLPETWRHTQTAHFDIQNESEVLIMERKWLFLRQIQRDAYLISRTAGDLAAQQGTLPERLIRQNVTRSGLAPLLNAMFR